MSAEDGLVKKKTQEIEKHIFYRDFSILNAILRAISQSYASWNTFLK